MSKKSSTFNEFDESPKTTETETDLSAVLDVTTFDTGPNVPNLFPRLTSASGIRIALIGEAPEEAEVYNQTPFSPLPTPTNPKSGASGRLLNDKLSQVGIIRDACFVGNICQHRPPSNDIKAFKFDGPEIQSGLNQLSSDLSQFSPNICVLMGRTALLAAKGVTDIGNWRGSLFIGDQPGPFLGRKCLATYHPAACLRQWSWTPLLWLDLKKAVAESTHPDFTPPPRNIRCELSFEELISELDVILQTKPELACDIEGWVHTFKCIALATSSFSAVVIPFENLDGSSYWSEDQEVEIWSRFAAIMADSLIHKCWQNGLYDRFVLQYGFNIVVFGNTDDTMLKFSEMYCELEKSLAFQNSILNNEPYYKFERKTNSLYTFLTYCGKDACTTYENNKRLDRLLGPGQKEHYRINNLLLNPLLYMELRGIRYDIDLAKKRLIEVNEHITKLQTELDSIAGFQQHFNDLSFIQNLFCDSTGQPKKGYKGKFKLAHKYLTSNKPLTTIQETYLKEILSVNIKSQLLKTYFYETLSLPKQFHEDPETHVKSLTTDYEALLRLSKLSKHPSIQVAIQIGLLRTRSQMLEISADSDGRIRCGYNIVGTETGRITCYTSPTGSGYNLQTIPDADHLKPKEHPLHQGMRDLILADQGCVLGQCDLSGADGWTVGAYLASLGDPTMLDDLRARLKPAQIICYMFRHGNTVLRGLTRDQIKPLAKEVKKEDWDYFFSKQGIWGTCYTMGPDTLIKRAFINSEGAIDLTRAQGAAFQNAVKARYHVVLWHNQLQRELKLKPELTAPNGFKRRFFGRWNEILGEALAHLPQVITTYATNTAMYKLWNDKENRTTSVVGSRLRIEPLHQVHDALIAQWQVEDTSWAVNKLKSYFDTPIIIAGQKITIPFEGHYGTNWALDEKSCQGDI
jgi:uracil-DNA glycosylase family 4